MDSERQIQRESQRGLKSECMQQTGVLGSLSLTLLSLRVQGTVHFVIGFSCVATGMCRAGDLDNCGLREAMLRMDSGRHLGLRCADLFSHHPITGTCWLLCFADKNVTTDDGNCKAEASDTDHECRGQG